MFSGYYNNTDSFQCVCVLLQTKTAPNSLVFVDGSRLQQQHLTVLCLLMVSGYNNNAA